MTESPALSETFAEMQRLGYLDAEGKWIPAEQRAAYRRVQEYPGTAESRAMQHLIVRV